jgi:large repetitive protein
MSTNPMKLLLQTVLTASALLGTTLAIADTTVNMIARQSTVTMPNGVTVPMWQYCGSVDATTTAAGTPPTYTGTANGGACTSTSWTPGPTIKVTVGETLTVNLTNNLPVPTSLIVLGHLGGGLGAPTTMASPNHNANYGVTPTSPVATINSISVNANQVTVTTAAAHGLIGGDRVFISGVSASSGTISGFNGGPFAITPTSLNSFTYVDLTASGNATGGSATTAVSASQGFTTFAGNALSGTAFVAPKQGQRVQSMGTQADAYTGSAQLTYQALKPGTYIYETGTLPSLQVPMGLYGLLIVTASPVTVNDPTTNAVTAVTTPGYAYLDAASLPTVPYDADATLLFSEIDPVMNAQIDKASKAGTDMTKNMRFNDPVCGANCYPAAVNYTPTYFMVNGQSFDRTAPQLSSFILPAAENSGNVLVRLANAGLRTHIPSIVGLQMSLVAEDGHLAPGLPKVQSEALLTAGKTYDAIVRPAVTPSTTGLTPTPAAYTGATFSVFDRQGSLTTANQPDGGMQAFLVVAGGTGGLPPAAASAVAMPDAYSLPVGGSLTFDVRLNDIAVKTATVVNAPAGTLTQNPDGTFTYTATATGTGFSDSFTYTGNGGTNGPVTNSAVVTLTVGSPAGAPSAMSYSYCSVGASCTSVPTNLPLVNVATQFSVGGPGVLTAATDPAGLKVSVDTGTATNNCGTGSQINADGSFTAVRSGTAPCVFTYKVKNSQGTLSAASYTATVSFPAQGSGLALNVFDAATQTPLTDYRWTIQEDLTFKHDTTKTPSLSTRTVGTSFHRAHNIVVATGCWHDPLDTNASASCGAGQQSRGTPLGTKTPVKVGDVVLDPTKHYYVSILPGDAQNPVTNAGGAPITDPVTGIQRTFKVPDDCGAINDPADPCGHMMGGVEIGAKEITAKAATIKVQRTPLVPAQLSVFIYNDNLPANGQIDANEVGLGGFNIIVFDPAGRSGDPAGQQTYDSFNMPLTNALLGQPGCPDDQNTSTNGTTNSATGNLVGVIYTCPNDPNDGTLLADPVKYALAGHALIKNITPARYDVIAHPGAAREGKGEIWWQTETLEGTPAQDAFTGINESVYFQEFGPPGFHTTIGFVQPMPSDPTVAGATITGEVTSKHMSRPSQTALYDAGSYDLLSSTSCRAALNSQGGTGPTVQAVECDTGTTTDASGKQALHATYTFKNVAPGDYEVQIFDNWLDQIIQAEAVTVKPADVGGTVPMLHRPVFSWFTQHDQNLLLDDGAGNLTGIPNALMSVRYRNGSQSNQTLTDVNGNGILVELFPLFNWYVSESDTTHFKQKQVNITVDGGGPVDTTGPGANLWSSHYPSPNGLLDTSITSVRTETPGATTYGIQSFISERNQINWVRTPYASNENGGIQGHVVLSSTRPYDDQRFNLQTIWEPLVPRVNMNLYRRVLNADGTETLSWVDSTTTSSFDDWVNTVAGMVNGAPNGHNYILGPDGSLRDVVTGVLAASNVTAGAQVNMSCPGQLPGPAAGALPPYDTTKVDPFTSYTLLGDVNRCYDGFHNWNQVQPAPYDGRYQFPSAAYVAKHPLCPLTGTMPANCTTPSTGQTLVSLPPGDYVVEAVTPPGYEIVKEEDKNILIGDAFIAPLVQQFGGLSNIFILPDQATLNNANPNNPNTGDPGFQSNPTSNLGVLASRGLGSARQPESECVGALHRVPDYLSLYPQAQQVAPFAGMDKPLCDRKLLKLADQMQTGTDFFVFTETPVAANATGIILDDASAEFNADSPDFGEKASVPFIPVSTKDFAGNEISRTYSDQWGAYNLMLPSSWLVNPPTPSGYGPNMLVNCINDPGPIDDPSGKIDLATGKVQKITDPAYNPAYSNFCYTNPFMPGQATYLDTPVLPIAAFAQGYNPADCAYPNLTPSISRVDAVDDAGTTPGAGNFGPYVPLDGGNLTITALGDQSVQNPDYAGPFATSGLASTRMITRHYGFGATQNGNSRVRMILPSGTAVTLPIQSWSDSSITVTVPPALIDPVTLAPVPRAGQLEVRATNGLITIDAVTVTQEDRTPVRVQASAGGTIQGAIDGAAPGDLVLVDAGHYNELVVMWKPVRLQGVGASSVIINAAKYPTSKLAVWRPEIDRLFGVDAVSGNGVPNPQVDPLRSQTVTGGIVLLEPTVLGSEEGAGITVLAKNPDSAACGSTAPSSYYDPTVLTGASGTIVNTTLPMSLSNFTCASSRIDGVAVTGGDAGGGIFVNGWAHGLEISNNRVYGNAGAYNGGIRIGVPYLENEGYPGQTQDANGNLVGSPTLSGNNLVGFGYDKNVKIHNNAVTKNGTVEAPLGGGGAGGGVSICSGTDGYLIDANWICGNYSSSDGAGIGHIGFSQGGVISNNNVLFNQSFQQTSSTHGGGIAIEGEPPIAGTLTLGTGNVTVRNNVIHGNFAEVGHGGGIRLQQVNGAEVAAFPATGATAVSQRNRWFQVTIQNNTIESNVSGWSGAGVSLSDALVTRMTGNTIRSNDSTGIAGPLLSGSTLPSTTTSVDTGRPNAAGVSSELTSAPLAAAVAATAQLTATQKAISSPTLTGGTVAYNRSFFYRSLPTGSTLCSSNNMADASGGTCATLNDQTTFGQCTATTAGAPAYWDFGVVGDNSTVPGPYALAPAGVTLTPTDTAYAGNTYNAAPVTLCNGARSDPRLASVINPPSPKNLQVAATIDEGNNYVSLRYGPLTLTAPTIPPTGTLAPGAGSPLAYDFGNQQVGSGHAVVFTFTNTSPTAVTLRTLAAGQFTTIGGTNPGEFVRSTPVGSTCGNGVAVAAGASCTFTVTFTPGATGTRGPATLSVFIAGQAAALVSENLTGTGVAPAGTLSPGAGSPQAYDFGSQQVAVGLPVVFTFTNTGTAGVTLRTLAAGQFTTIGGTNAGEFVRSTPVGSTCGNGVLVAAGASCTFTVTFTPGATGTRGPATLSVFIAGQAAALVSENLTGTGVAPSGSLAPGAGSPQAFNFGNQLVNAGLPVVFTFTNTSSVAVQLRSTGTGFTAVGGTNPANFVRSTPAGSTCGNGVPVAAGASCTFTVTFTPSAVGSRGATLSVFIAGQAAALVSENLTGTGVNIAPNPADLGTQTVNSPSAAKQLTVINTTGGGVILRGVNPVTISGANPADFAVTANSCTGTIASGATCAISVTFTPSATGARSATINVVRSNATTFATDNLTGTGL